MSGSLSASLSAFVCIVQLKPNYVAEKYVLVSELESESTPNVDAPRMDTKEGRLGGQDPLLLHDSKLHKEVKTQLSYL